MMERRKPTYGAAVRMAQLVAVLSRTWRPLSVPRLLETLNCSERTLRRYRKALNENLSSVDGGPFLRVTREGGLERWYLPDREEVYSGNYFKIISVMVARVLLVSFEETVLESGMKQALSLFTGRLPPSGRKQLESFDRKIRYTGFGRKSYADQDINLAAILRGLIHQKKLEIRHFSHTASREKRHIIRPYTLLLHRDSLYLHAYAEDYRQVRTFSMDRIREVRLTGDTFKYPAGFDPDKMLHGSFGIFGEPGAGAFKVAVSFKKVLHEYITTRLWHPTQKFTEIKKGAFIMELRLTNTREFLPWVLQFGSDARTLEPASLRA